MFTIYQTKKNIKSHGRFHDQAVLRTMWTLSCLLISTNTNLNNVISYKLKNKVFPIQIYTLFYSCALFSIIFRCLFVWCRIKCDRRYFLFDQVCPLNFVKQKKQRLCLLLGIVKSVEEMLELHNITEKFVNRHRIMQRKQQDKEKCLHSKSVCRPNVTTPKDWFINITSVLKKFETLFYVINIHCDTNKIIANKIIANKVIANKIIANKIIIITVSIET